MSGARTSIAITAGCGELAAPAADADTMWRSAAFSERAIGEPAAARETMLRETVDDDLSGGLYTEDPVRYYLDELRQHPRLTPEQEQQITQALAKACRTFYEAMLSNAFTADRLIAEVLRVVERGSGHDDLFESSAAPADGDRLALLQPKSAVLTELQHRCREIFAALDSDGVLEAPEARSTIFSQTRATLVRELLELAPQHKVLEGLRTETLRKLDDLAALGAVEGGTSARSIATRHEMQHTPESAAELARIIRTSHAELSEHAQALALGNLGLVMGIAKQYRKQGVALPDLIDEGIIGLMRACYKFQPERGLRFSTYAAWGIRDAIGRAVIRLTQTIQVPVYINGLRKKINHAGEQLLHKLGRDPHREELAEATGLDLEKVTRVQASMLSRYSLDGGRRHEETERTDRFTSDHGGGQRELQAPLERQELSRWVTETLRTLDLRHKVVVQLRCGLFEGTSYSLADVGKILGVTRERVRQLEEKALSQIREREALRGKRVDFKHKVAVGQTQRSGSEAEESLTDDAARQLTARLVHRLAAAEGELTYRSVLRVIRELFPKKRSPEREFERIFGDSPLRQKFKQARALPASSQTSSDRKSVSIRDILRMLPQDFRTAERRY